MSPINIFRNWRFEQQLANLLWKINVQEIDFRHVMTSAMSVGSNVSSPAEKGINLLVLCPCTKKTKG